MNDNLTLRISDHSIAFSVHNGDGISYQPYDCKEGVAIAANLRDAVRDRANADKVTICIDSPVLLVPTDLYEPSQAASFYYKSYPSRENFVIESNVIVNLGSVALFSMSKDLWTVISDNFPETTILCVMAPVWRYLYQRSLTGTCSRLFAYFHDGKVDVFCFSQHRFKFSNAFEVASSDDALYFLLYVWKQLALNQERDELHLVGDIPDKLVDELQKFIRKTYIINPAGDFNRATVTKIPGMPYDLMTLYVKGR